MRKIFMVIITAQNSNRNTELSFNFIKKRLKDMK